jgi:hypothetical protein
MRILVLVAGSHYKDLVVCMVRCAVVLAQSGLNSIIAEPGGPRYAEYAAKVYTRNLTDVPSARWIWDGPGNTSTCNMNITVQETFTIQYLNQPILVYVGVDNWYTSEILGVAGTGSDWSNAEIYNVSTAGQACGI